MHASLIKQSTICTLLLAIGSFGSSSAADGSTWASNVTQMDEYTLSAEKHLLQGYPAVNDDGSVNVVVEIPTGTTAKWEVDKNSGNLVWEFKNGAPRVVSYLGYPGNYGMIPQTLLPASMGGDGDPLDVLVLAPAIPRGSLVQARVIGVLKLLDSGEIDDKIIAVLPDTKLGKVTSIEALQREFIGVADIVETWLGSYKGPGEIESIGYEGVLSAKKIIDASAAEYAKTIP